MGTSSGTLTERSVCEETDALPGFQFVLLVVLGIADGGISCPSLIMDEDGVGARGRVSGEPTADCSLSGDVGEGALPSLADSSCRTPGNVRSSSEI